MPQSKSGNKQKPEVKAGYKTHILMGVAWDEYSERDEFTTVKIYYDHCPTKKQMDEAFNTYVKRNGLEFDRMMLMSTSGLFEYEKPEELRKHDDEDEDDDY